MYRNSLKEMTVFGTKKLDMELYNKMMKSIKKPEIRLESNQVLKGRQKPDLKVIKFENASDECLFGTSEPILK